MQSSPVPPNHTSRPGGICTSAFSTSLASSVPNFFSTRGPLKWHMTHDRLQASVVLIAPRSKTRLRGACGVNGARVTA